MAAAALRWLAERGRTLRWFMTSLMGDRAYEEYVRHLAVEHPGLTPVSERAFWAERYREQELNPGSRCC